MFDSDFSFYGKHATYVKYLAKKNGNEVQESETPETQLYERYIDVYMNGAIFGLLYNRRAKKDSSSTARANILAGAFKTEKANCIFLYRLVMLLDKTQNLSPEERINRAFRYDTQPNKNEEVKNNMELFHDYVRGGIEYMYELFTNGCQTQEDYIVKSYEVMKEFKDVMNGKSYDEELMQLIN